MKSNTPTPATLPIGAAVQVELAAGVTATGTLEGISKGWFVVALDHPEQHPDRKSGKVSVRGAHIRAAAPVDLGPAMEAAEGDFDEEEAAHDAAAEDDAIDAFGADLDDDADLDELEAALTAAQKMAEALRKARVRYTKTRRPSGAASADNGDKIAAELRNYEPDEVCGLADVVLNVARGTHLAKYGHLNNGQQRMNSGNRIRAHYKNTAGKAGEGDAIAIAELVRLNRLFMFDDAE